MTTTLTNQSMEGALKRQTLSIQCLCFFVFLTLNHGNMLVEPQHTSMNLRNEHKSPLKLLVSTFPYICNILHIQTVNSCLVSCNYCLHDHLCPAVFPRYFVIFKIHIHRERDGDIRGESEGVRCWQISKWRLLVHTQTCSPIIRQLDHLNECETGPALISGSTWEAVLRFSMNCPA